jgi:hypothetical protein
MPRGRPRKYPTKEPYLGPKRPRGRPRKIQAVESSPSAPLLSAESVDPSPLLPPSTFAAMPTAPLLASAYHVSTPAPLPFSCVSLSSGKRLRPEDTDTPRKLVLRVQSSPSLAGRRRLLEKEALEGRVNMLFGDTDSESSLHSTTVPSLVVRQTKRALQDATLTIADNGLAAPSREELCAEVDIAALIRHYGSRLPEFGQPTVWPVERKITGRDLSLIR